MRAWFHGIQLAGEAACGALPVLPKATVIINVPMRCGTWHVGKTTAITNRIQIVTEACSIDRYGMLKCHFEPRFNTSTTLEQARVPVNSSAIPFVHKNDTISQPIRCLVNNNQINAPPSYHHRSCTVQTSAVTSVSCKLPNAHHQILWTLRCWMSSPDITKIIKLHYQIGLGSPRNNSNTCKTNYWVPLIPLKMNSCRTHRSIQRLPVVE
jgi:hypothetical protein